MAMFSHTSVHAHISYQQTGVFEIPQEVFAETSSKALKYLTVSNVACQLFSEGENNADSWMSQFLFCNGHFLTPRLIFESSFYRNFPSFGQTEAFVIIATQMQAMKLGKLVEVRPRTAPKYWCFSKIRLIPYHLTNSMGSVSQKLNINHALKLIMKFALRNQWKFRFCWSKSSMITQTFSLVYPPRLKASHRRFLANPTHPVEMVNFFDLHPIDIFFSWRSFAEWYRHRWQFFSTPCLFQRTINMHRSKFPERSITQFVSVSMAEIWSSLRGIYVRNVGHILLVKYFFTVKYSWNSYLR